MTDQDCIFCKIASGEIPAQKLLETEDLVAFEDINPQAPVHFLVIPKKHIPTLDDVTQEDTNLVGQMLYHAANIAREKGIAADGYRQIINCRQFGGQIVFHLHLHIMGGRPMNRMG
jgi:histidine triad (HIT) family protein